MQGLGRIIHGQGCIFHRQGCVSHGKAAFCDLGSTQRFGLALDYRGSAIPDKLCILYPCRSCHKHGQAGMIRGQVCSTQDQSCLLQGHRGIIDHKGCNIHASFAGRAALCN